MQQLISPLINIRFTGILPCALLLLFFVAMPNVVYANPPQLITPDEKKALASHRLEKLRLGQVLYEYYQQQPLKSLEAIAIAKHYGIANEDKAQLQLVQGGASLQLGLSEAAMQLLTELLAKSQTESVQAQAWYWLAKTAFQQGLYSTSQQAKAYLQDNQLMTFIEEEQWLELQYQSAFFALKSNPDNWRNTVAVLPEGSIWYPYLMANAGIEFFNQQDYANAADLLVQAIEAAKIQPEESWITESFLEWSWWPWSEETERVDESPEVRERNTLLDRLYFSVGQTFVKQNDHTAAFNAFKQIQADSLYAEQGLLSYGWALANEERWSEALPVWQHLRQQGKGLPSLQATHALAYGFEQLTDYAKAYSMLAESLNQLEKARLSLGDMQTLKNQAEFIFVLAERSELPDSWPLIHQDLILDLLSGDNTQNTAKQLQTLVQLNDISRYIEKQQTNLDHLEAMLDERQEILASRAAAISVDKAAKRVEQYTQTLDRLAQKVANAPNSPENFANSEQIRHQQRLNASFARLDRLIQNGLLEEDKRSSASKKLNRLKGIVAWQLREQQIMQQHQHDAAIQLATQELQLSTERLSGLIAVTSNPTQLSATISNQRQRLLLMRSDYQDKYVKTQELKNQLASSLQAYLLNLMQQRDAVLLEQITATKLAMLRMRDVSFSRQQALRDKP